MKRGGEEDITGEKNEERVREEERNITGNITIKRGRAAKIDKEGKERK